jgi:hypothetical protein
MTGPPRWLVAVGRLARTAVRYEIRMWVSLARWVARRPSVEPESVPFGYGRALTPIIGGLIIASAIEIPVLHLLIPWEPVRFVVDVLGVYGFVWMIGLLAMTRAYPHLVTPRGLRVRATNGLDVTIPWDYIGDIRSVTRTVPGPRNVVADASSLQVAVMSQTHVDVVLRGPTVVELPRGETEPLRVVSFAADDPADLVRLARERLSAIGSARRPADP